MIEFKLPSLGADMDQGKLLKWRVKPGDNVKRGDVIAVVDTTKAAIDVEIWQEGTVWELLVKPDTTIPVGAVMARLLAPGETAEGAAREPPRAPAAPPGLARQRVSPAARKRATELGVSLEQVVGTGPQGAVTLQDVEKAAPQKAPVKDRAAEMRQVIAAAMTRSKREIPHYYLGEDIPMESALLWLARQNERRRMSERLLLAPLLLKAVAMALRNFSELNGYWRDGGFVAGAAINVGVAIALRQGGLVAPAILNTDRKDLGTLMRELADLVQRARAGSLRSSELADATITVTNLGDQGVSVVHGVIYPPQVALVGFGRVSPRPWAVDNEIKAIPVISASLAADHRVSDGHRGGRFLAAMRDLLQQPESLATEKA